MDFRSQKGATGADIIIAATVIVLTIAIVSMIYVNTTLQSRNVTRTAGATRIATNILENIEKMTYTDFCTEYGNDNEGIPWIIASGDYSGYKSTTNTTVFNTKIPQGYTLYISAEPNYGSSTDSSEQFDLVRDIKLVVTYNVGDVTEKVEFDTTKEREIVSEVNIPVTSILFNQGILKNNKNFYPVKYSETAKAYLKTTEEDSEWYNYSNKKWATIIVSNENNLFDANGKLIADSSKYEKYVWIPRFFYTDENKFSEFAYLTTDMAIRDSALSSKSDTTSLNYTTYSGTKTTSKNVTNMGNFTGIWFKVAETVDNSDYDNYYKMLNESIYGPYENH